MRAVAVRAFRANPEEMDLPKPTPGRSEILVRVEFAGVNPYDAKIADGLFEGRRPHVFPLVLGVDAAGVVEAVGADAHRFRSGDRVAGQFLHDPVGTGTYAEFTIVPETNAVVPMPPELPSDQAAALPTAGMTALSAVEMLGLSRGETLAIVGASGGVGSFATIFAAARGWRVVALARSASAVRLRSIGAEVVVDPTSPDSPATLARGYPGGFDGLLDLMSDRTGFPRFASMVRRGGSALSTVYAAEPGPLANLGVRAVNVDLQPSPALMERLIGEVLGQKLVVPVEKRVLLSDAAAAIAELKAGRGHGKTVVDLRPQ